jgi:hypothetical protein
MAAVNAGIFTCCYLADIGNGNFVAVRHGENDMCFLSVHKI